jgi:hypothetical protein
MAVQTLNVETVRITELLDDLQSQKLIIPRWQRDYCWDISTAALFVKRCKQNPMLISPVHLAIQDDGVPNLMDGRQRLTTLQFEKFAPRTLAMSDDEAEHLVSSLRVSVFRHKVENERQAIDLFRDINRSTSLIAYELFRPILDCDDTVSSKWYPGLRTNCMSLLQSYSGISLNTFINQYQDNRKRFGQSADRFWDYSLSGIQNISRQLFTRHGTALVTKT